MGLDEKAVAMRLKMDSFKVPYIDWLKETLCRHTIKAQQRSDTRTRIEMTVDVGNLLSGSTSVQHLACHNHFRELGP